MVSETDHSSQPDFKKKKHMLVSHHKVNLGYNYYFFPVYFILVPPTLQRTYIYFLRSAQKTKPESRQGSFQSANKNSKRFIKCKKHRPAVPYRWRAARWGCSPTRWEQSRWPGLARHKRTGCQCLDWRWTWATCRRWRRTSPGGSSWCARTDN